MHLGKSNMMATLGMAVGILIIAGSAIGGIALASDRDREQAPDPAGSTVPLSNDSELAPSVTPSADDGSVDDAGDDRLGDQSQPAGSTQPGPSAAPTCTDDDDPGQEEHPTEDCDDRHD